MKNSSIYGAIAKVSTSQLSPKNVTRVGVAAWERSVGRPSRNRLENGHANHHRYRITTPVLNP